jgi:hypothetical protein
MQIGETTRGGGGGGVQRSGRGGNDVIHAGGGADWVFAWAGEDWFDGGGWKRRYDFRLMVSHNGYAYSAGTHLKIRSQAGEPTSQTRELRLDALVPMTLFGMEIEVMKRAAGSETTKVSRGGTPRNGTWRLAA